MYKKAHASIRANPTHEKKPTKEIKKKRWVLSPLCDGATSVNIEKCIFSFWSQIVTNFLKEYHGKITAFKVC